MPTNPTAIRDAREWHRSPSNWTGCYSGSHIGGVFGDDVTLTRVIESL